METEDKGLDNSSWDGPEGELEEEERTGSHIKPGLLAFFLVFTLLGSVSNLLVVAAISLSKSLWKPSFFYVLNVSVAQFLLCAVYGPYSILTALTYPPGGSCEVMGIIMHWTLMTSLITLAAIAVNRLLLVYHTPAAYQRLYSPVRTGISIAIIWTLSFLSLVPLFVGPSEAGYDPKMGMCVGRMSDPDTYLYELLLATLIGIPCIVIIFYSYFRIWKIFHTSVRAAQPNSSQQNQHNAYKLTRNLFTITAIITVSWFPMFFLVFIDYNYRAPSAVYKVCHCLALSHAVINPILYIVLNRNLSGVYCTMAWRGSS